MSKTLAVLWLLLRPCQSHWLCYGSCYGHVKDTGCAVVTLTAMLKTLAVLWLLLRPCKDTGCAMVPVPVTAMLKTLAVLWFLLRSCQRHWLCCGYSYGHVTYTGCAMVPVTVMSKTLALL
ncbi:hypothetical protein ACJMK2_030968 [Sinanodonta woodiana]|uniref:Secreted protein n=1 Tax=Sinanodonta woodiana TaxID=1069815 RepID=A0ABD3WXX2_SINWO